MRIKNITVTVLRTSIGGRYDIFVMSTAGLYQRIQKECEDTARPVNDNVQQFSSCFDWLSAFGLNGLQFFQCQRVALEHVAGDGLCVHR